MTKNERERLSYRGVSVKDLTREELEDALLEMYKAWQEQLTCNSDRLIFIKK